MNLKLHKLRTKKLQKICLFFCRVYTNFVFHHRTLYVHLYIPDYQATMECNFEDLTLPGCKVTQYAENSSVSWVINKARPMNTWNSGPSIDSTFMTGICHSSSV